MGGVVRSAELRTNISKIICKFTFLRYICTRKQAIREFSSAGSEHLPYKQRVGGSNPSTPTRKKGSNFGALFSCGSILPTMFTFPPPAPSFEKEMPEKENIIAIFWARDGVRDYGSRSKKYLSNPSTYTLFLHALRTQNSRC